MAIAGAVLVGPLLGIGTAAAAEHPPTPPLALTQSTSTTTTRPVTPLDPAFLQKANGVCEQMVRLDKAVGPFPFPNFDPEKPTKKDLPKIAAYWSRFVPEERALPKKIAALGSPATGAVTWQKLRKLVLQFDDISLAQYTAARNVDVGKFVAEVKAATTNQAALAALAVPAGFSKDSACSQAF